MSVEPIFGDGRPAPPIVSRETIDLQRACELVCESVQARLPKGVLTKAELDLSPTLARLFFHYTEITYRTLCEENSHTIELDLTVTQAYAGDAWLRKRADEVLETMAQNASDLLIPESPFDYLRICDHQGNALYEQGTPTFQIR